LHQQRLAVHNPTDLLTNPDLTVTSLVGSTDAAASTNAISAPASKKLLRGLQLPFGAPKTLAGVHEDTYLLSEVC